MRYAVGGGGGGGDGGQQQAKQCIAMRLRPQIGFGAERERVLLEAACIVQRTRNTHYVNMHVLLVTGSHTPTQRHASGGRRTKCAGVRRNIC